MKLKDWKAFQEYRQKKRKQIFSSKAYKKAVKELDELKEAKTERILGRLLSYSMLLPTEHIQNATYIFGGQFVYVIIRDSQQHSRSLFRLVGEKE